MTATKKGLGRGLGALITEAVPETQSGIISLDINKIEPNKQQPRKYFDEDTLAELAESIKSYGIIQPLIVKEENGYYSIIAGERRWRAARLAKLTEVPVIIKEYTETETLQIALIENLQRQDLNPIEEAICFKKLIEDFFFTQDDVASKIGKSRNAISYALSLLQLDARVQEMIIEGKLSSAHGRVLLQIEDKDLMAEAAEKIAAEEMSAREADALIKSLQSVKKDNPGSPSAVAEHPYRRFEDELKGILGTNVLIKDGKKKGKIEIEYYSPDELDRLLCMFKRFEG